MIRSTDSRTVSTTLLQRLKIQDQDAYVRLQHLFHATVTRRLKRLGVAAGDVDDLTQDVFLRVWKGLARFQRDGRDASFRRWLQTIIRHVAMDYFQRPQPGRIGTDLLVQLPETLPDDEATSERAGEVHRMLEMVRGDFAESTYQIFVRYWLHGHETDRLAHEYGMTKGAVRAARDRVMRRLRESYFDLYGESEWPFARPLRVDSP
jgi:RNA polymerase sigma-70 factor (ECF subfamily)